MIVFCADRITAELLARRLREVAGEHEVTPATSIDELVEILTFRPVHLILTDRGMDIEGLREVVEGSRTDPAVAVMAGDCEGAEPVSGATMVCFSTDNSLDDFLARVEGFLDEQKRSA